MATTKFTFDEASLRILYDMLCATVMFPLDLRLPPEWLIRFEITKDDEAYGWANPEDEHGDPFGEYTIEVSKVKNTTYKDLVETLLHEMTHIHLHHIGIKDWDEHLKNSPFSQVKARIDMFTGFDIS